MPSTLPEGYSLRTLEVRPSLWGALKAHARKQGLALHAALENAIEASKRVKGRRKRIDRAGTKEVLIAMNGEIHAYLWDLKKGRGQRIADTIDHAITHYLPDAVAGQDSQPTDGKFQHPQNNAGK